MKKDQVYVLNRKKNGEISSLIEQMNPSKQAEDLYEQVFTQLVFDISLKIKDGDHSILLNQICPPLADYLIKTNDSLSLIDFLPSQDKTKVNQVKDFKAKLELIIYLFIKNFKKESKKFGLIKTLEKNNKLYSILNQVFFELPTPYIFRLVDSFEALNK